MNRLPLGTLVNMATVVIGSLLGLALQKVFPDNLESIIFQAIGLGTIVIGVSMSLKIPAGYLLTFIFCLILGGITGELIGLQEALYQLGDWVKASMGIEDNQFTTGLITAFLLFCIGSVTIVGAIEEGIQGKRELLYIKSTLDGITSVAFASTYGIGVLFSIFPMFLFQGGITFLARSAERFFTQTLIDFVSAVGGVLIIGVGINMLKLGVINLENLLPAILFALILGPLQEWGRGRWSRS